MDLPSSLPTRHSREGGNPVAFEKTLGPRLRGDDDTFFLPAMAVIDFLETSKCVE